MPEITENDPPEPPYEANNEPVEQPEGKVRERVWQILSTVTEPAKVSTIGDMANCSAEGARTALREYAEMGVVIKTNDNPEKYKRNSAYFEFLRGHSLAQDHTTDELNDRLIKTYQKHSEFAEEFGATSPDEVDVDEREAPERFDALLNWKSALSEADDLREALRQQTGTTPPAAEAITNQKQAGAEVEFVPEPLEEGQSISPIYFTAPAETLSEQIMGAQPPAEEFEEINQRLSEMTEMIEQMKQAQIDAGE
jgi:hypothetical protein